MTNNLSNYTPNDLLEYKEDIINILDTQIDVLKKIEDNILRHEENDNSGDNSRVLSPSKSAEFRQILQGEISKIENFDVVLAVVGTMKAGKSTTVNSIVGREILPNRNRPMTALPTLICHNPKQKDPKLSFQNTAINRFLEVIRHNLSFIPDFNSNIPEIRELIEFITLKETFSNEYHGSENIFLFLQKLNDLVRLTSELNDYLLAEGLDSIEFPYHDYRNIEQLPIIEVAFNTIENNFNTQGRFMLLDTPGPNEAGQGELKVMLREQLERSSAVLLVLDYTQLNSEAEADVKAQISEIPTIQKSRLFAVVNKFDQKTANSDDEQATINHVYQSLLRGMIEEDHIYPISAQDAYMANRMKTFIENNNGAIPNYKPGTWIEDFADTAYGRKAESKYARADTEEINEIIEELIEDSKVQPLLSNVIFNMQQNAPIIAIQSALTGSSKVFNDLHNFFSIRSFFTEKEKLTDAEIIQLQKSIDELNKQRNSLKKLSDKILSQTQRSLDKVFKECEKKLEIVDKSINSEVEKYFNSIDAELDDKHNSELEDELKSGFLHKLFSNSEDNLKQELWRTISKDSKSDPDAIFFENKDNAKEFLTGIEKIVLLIRSDVENIFNQLKTDIQRNTRKQFNDIESSVNYLLDNIQDEFKKTDIKINLDFKVFNKNNNLFSDSINLSDSVKLKERKRTIRAKERGITGGIKRFLGNFFNSADPWGYKNETHTLIKIEKKQLINTIKTRIKNDLFTTIRKELENEKHRVENLVNDKINDIESICSELIEEFKFNIEQEKTPDLHKKMAYKEQLNYLSRTYTDTQEDWKMLAIKFNVKALSNEEA